jgi:hypothetical protein
LNAISQQVYCQFGIAIEVKEDMQPTGKAIGLDMGLLYFYAVNFLPFGFLIGVSLN